MAGLKVPNIWFLFWCFCFQSPILSLLANPTVSPTLAPTPEPALHPIFDLTSPPIPPSSCSSCNLNCQAVPCDSNCETCVQENSGEEETCSCLTDCELTPSTCGTGFTKTGTIQSNCFLGFSRARCMASCTNTTGRCIQCKAGYNGDPCTLSPTPLPTQTPALLLTRAPSRTGTPNPTAIASNQTDGSSEGSDEGSDNHTTQGGDDDYSNGENRNKALLSRYMMTFGGFTAIGGISIFVVWFYSRRMYQVKYQLRHFLEPKDFMKDGETVLHGFPEEDRNEQSSDYEYDLADVVRNQAIPKETAVTNNPVFKENLNVDTESNI